MPQPNLSFLDTLGSSDKGDPLKLTTSQKALIEIAATFATNAGDNLNRVDSNSTGNLADSIVPLEPIINGKSVKVDIEVASYYKFVNKGVKGWADTKGSGSPYSFKKPVSRKGSGPKSSKMVTAVRKWLIREGLKTRDRTKKKVAISTRESKRQKKTFTDTSTKTAIIISANIRKRGLRKTNFWDDAVKTLEQNIADKIGGAAKIDIINSL